MSVAISLIMTVYNRDRYLKTAIDSVLTQTWSNFELIIWDDGSTDDSLAIAQDYADRDRRVQVFSSPHQGRVASLQNAIAQSQGQFLALVDSDDILAPTTLADTLSILLLYPQVGFVYTDYIDIDSEGNTLGYGKRCQIPFSHDRLLLDFITFHFRLMRRSVYEQVGGFTPDNIYAEDYDLCLKMSEVSEVYHLQKPLYYYRHHRENIGYQYTFNQAQYSVKAINKAIKRRNLSDKIKVDLEIKNHFPLDYSVRLAIKKFAGLVLGIIPVLAINTNSVFAQNIAPNLDGTGTVINQNGNQIDISGGAKSLNGANLFHSFSQFGLNQGQIANFLSSPEIINILGRINGGNPSFINGLIQVSGGNSNLFLMNPAGIIFGQNASLNINGDFTATTAGGIGFAGGNFNAFGNNDYSSLGENPTNFIFTGNGAIANNGNLAVSEGKNLNLLGSTVINTGTISAPGGKITVAAIPEQKIFRISQQGYVLTLDVPENYPKFQAQTLPQLLTGGNLQNATGLTVNNNGQLVITQSGTVIPSNSGTNIISGNVNTDNLTTGKNGGNINIIGQEVGIIDQGNLSARGDHNGGTILIGGDYQGNGNIPNSQAVFIGKNSTINADAIANGNGGNIVIWSDQATRIYGNITAKGGNNSGNGGFVETSGKTYLDINTTPDITALNGQAGTWLIDPSNITIISGNIPGTLDPLAPNFTANTDSSTITNTAINTALDSGANVVISTQNPTGTESGDIIQQTGAPISRNFGSFGTITNLTFRAAGNITLNDTITAGFGYGLNVLLEGETAGTRANNITINNNIITSSGNFTSLSQTFNSTTGNITTANGNIDINTTGSLNLGNINSGGGNVTVTSNNAITINPNTTVRTSGGDFTSLSQIFNSTTVDIITHSGFSGTSGGNININANVNLVTGNLTSGDLLGSSSGTITVTNSGTGNIGISGNISSNATTTVGDVTINGNVSLLNDITVIAQDNSSSGLGNITISGTIDKGTTDTVHQNLTIQAGNNVTFGGEIGTKSLPVGNGTIATSLGNLSVAAQNTTINGNMITTDGSTIEFNNSTIKLNNDAILKADEINFNQNFNANSFNLTLQQASSTRDIQIGFINNNSSALSITAGELGFLNNLQSLTIGQIITGTNTVSTVSTGVTFNAPTTIQSTLSGNIVLNGNVTGVGNASLLFIGNTTINGNTIKTANQNIQIIGNVLLGNNVTIDKGNTTGLGYIIVDGNVNGTGQNLTLTSGTGNQTLIQVTGNIGNSGSVGDIIAVSNGANLFNGSINANSIDTSQGNGITLLQGNVTTIGEQKYNGIGIGGTTNLTSNTGNVIFNQILNTLGTTSQSLTVNANAGNVTFNGPVGAAGNVNFNGNVVTLSALGDLIVNSNGTTLFNSTVQSASLQTDGPGTTILNGDVTVNGLITLNDPVNINQNINVTSNTGNITFNNIVTGNHNLTINTPVDLLFNSTVGNSSTLLDDLILNVNGTTTFNGVVYANTVTTNLTGTTILNANINSNGTQTYNDQVVIGNTVTLNTTNSDINFNNIVSSNSSSNDLTLNTGSGNINFNSTVGDSSVALGSIAANSSGTTRFNNTVYANTVTTDVGGNTIINGNINTNGNQTYLDQVSVTNSVTLNSNSGNVSFNNTLNSNSTNNNLTINSNSGNVTFNQGVGTVAQFGAIAVNSSGTTRFNNTVFANTVTTDVGGTTILNGNITTTGNQTYSDQVTLNNNSTLTSNENITFGQDILGNKNLTAIANSGNLTFNGNLGNISTPVGNVILTSGNTTSLNQVNANSLTSNGTGTTRLNGNVTTIDQQNYNQSVLVTNNISLNTTNSNINFNNIVSSNSSSNDLTLNTGSGNINFNSTVGDSSVALGSIAANSSGTTRFNNTVYANTVTTDVGGNTIINGNINTNGNQTYLDQVSVTNSVTLNSNSGNVSFNDTLNSNSTTNNLTINSNSGNVTFNQGVGTAAQFGAIAVNSSGTTLFNSSFNGSSLTTDSLGTTILNGNVTTSASQTYNDLVTLNNNITLTSSNENITFGQDVLGNQNVTAIANSGNLTFNGNLGNISTPVGNVTLTSGNTTSLNQVNANNITTNGTGTTRLNGNVTTIDQQNYNQSVLVTNNISLNTTNSNINFNNNLSGNPVTNSLSVNSGSGNINFNGTVTNLGNITANSSQTTTFNNTVNVGNLNTDANGTTVINGNVNTSGTQTYNDDVITNNNINLTANNTNINFGKTVNANNTNNTLTVSTGTGDINFNGSVGNTTQYNSLTTNSQGTTNFNNVNVGTLTTNGTGTVGLNGNITTNTAQNYNQPLELNQNVTLNSGNSDINFNNTITANNSTNDLTVNTGSGNINFNGTVGNNSIAIANLVANSTATTRFNTVNANSVTTNAGGNTILAGNITTIGGQNYNDQVQLNSNITLNSNGDINFANNVTSNSSTNNLTINSNNGAVGFFGSVGNSNIPLNDLLVNSSGTTTFNNTINANTLTTNLGGNTIIGGNITTNGAQNYGDRVILTNNINLNTNNSDINFNDTVNGFSSISSNLNITVGNGNINFNSSLGNTTTILGNITINTVNNINVLGNINARSFKQIAGTGNSNLLGDINTYSNGVEINTTGNINTNNINTFGGLITLNTAGNINTNNINTFGGLITLNTANGSINTGNLNSSSSNIGFLTANGAIALSALQSSITTGNINSSGFNNGGNVTIKAGTQITTGNINTSGINGNGGSVLLDPTGDIEVGYINTQGEIFGGNVDITTDRFFRATSSFIDFTEKSASISTIGGQQSGTIIIRHGGGNVNTAFIVGDATINGTESVITRGGLTENSILPTRSFPGTHKQDSDRIQIITKDIPIKPPEETTPPKINIDHGGITPISINTGVTEIDGKMTSDVSKYLGKQEQTQIKNLEETQAILNGISEQTGVKPALIYVTFAPPIVAEKKKAVELKDSDELEIVVITGKEAPIYRRITKSNRQDVLTLARQFRNSVIDISQENAYQEPAEKMYKLLISPIEEDLKSRGINNLVFLMDNGLRSIPLAAMFDGKQFLVEKYSIGLMPSLSLTDTRYKDIRDSQVLALGAAKFAKTEEQNPLPAVPIEIETITKKLWKGEYFLNQDFTESNITQKRRNTPFGILHLATHGDFRKGAVGNSYIQFWNNKLPLDKLNTLGLNDPPVELLVLSACKTALGDEEAELGFAGFAVMAGVKSAVGSLWYVSDEGTLGLMTDFYDYLRKAPIKAEGLRQAQIALLTGNVTIKNGQVITRSGNLLLPPELENIENKDLKHPYYWAGFTMIGNPW
jgi:CHAT domain-containing protein/glycosyltransferase involved in cell wall biosynthesis